jgi:hypothetical protein
LNNHIPPPHYPDPEAHEPGCMGLAADIGVSDTGRYVDIFCECHRYTEPKILSDGTDIAWPAGWDQVQALEWRRAHDLQLPIEA